MSELRRRSLLERAFAAVALLVLVPIMAVVKAPKEFAYAVTHPSEWEGALLLLVPLSLAAVAARVLLTAERRGPPVGVMVLGIGVALLVLGVWALSDLAHAFAH